MLYSLLNLGGAVAGFAIDYLAGEPWDLGVLGVRTPISGMRMALLMGFVSNAVCWVLAFTLRPTKVEDEEDAAGQDHYEQSLFVDVAPAESQPAAVSEEDPGKPLAWTTTEEARRRARPEEFRDVTLDGLEPGVAVADEDARRQREAQAEEANEDGSSRSSRNPLVVLRAVVAERNFGRFFWLMMLLTAIQTEWHHNSATLPKFLIRLHGDTVRRHPPQKKSLPMIMRCQKPKVHS